MSTSPRALASRAPDAPTPPSVANAPAAPSVSPAPALGRRRRLGYFINCFPNFIEAMIYREVMALRARGFELSTFSIRRPNDADVPAEAKALLGTTTYILPVRPAALVAAHLRAFLDAPSLYVGTLLEVVGGTHIRLRDRWRSVCHFVEGVAIAPEVRRLGIEHLHAHWAVGAATCAMVVARFLRIPFTFTAHAYDIWLDKLLLPEKLAAAELVLTCTDYNRRHLIETYGAPPDKLRVVYHGLDLERFQRRHRPANPVPVILSVGRLVEQKGYEDLIHACAHLARAGVAFRCEIVGDGPLRERLAAVIAELGLHEQVILAGRVVGDAILDCYERADLFALPCVEASDGDRDGIPNTMIEAMAMEIPVVSTRYTGVPELVIEEQNGLLTECGDRVAIAAALRRLLADPELRTTMGRAGRARVMADFATAAALAKLERVFAPPAGESAR